MIVAESGYLTNLSNPRFPQGIETNGRDTHFTSPFSW